MTRLFSYRHFCARENDARVIFYRFTPISIQACRLKVETEKCIGCWRCIPYCPVNAFTKSDEVVSIEQETCLECGTCLRADICPTKALYIQELHWPRTIRAAFSGTNYSGYDKVLEKQPEPMRRFEDGKYWGGGRGTSEMKTNEITKRYDYGEVGIGCEFGRPGVGFYFRELEMMTSRLVQEGIQLEPMNPVTKLLDIETGRIKEEYEAIRDERALSGIIEFKVAEDEGIQILRLIQDLSREIDTVFSVDIISRCEEGKIPFKSFLDEAGIDVAINGKTCIGLGRVPE